jgi:hypothetical protein
MEVAMKRLGYFGCAVVLAAGLADVHAQDVKSKTKVSVEDGKNITVTGCVQRDPDGGFLLTNVAGKDGARGSYLLVADDEDLGKHLGHRVEVSGKAADQGKGKIAVETKNEVKTTDGDKKKTESKSEVKGDLAGLPYLGVKSVRTIATVCP